MPDDPSLPPPPAVIVRRKGLGCLPTGCLVVVVILMVLGVFFGSTMWLFTQGGQAFLSDQPRPVQIAEVTDDQYQAVLAKLTPFGQAMNEGRAATVELTPDDLNVLIARNPQFAFWRGKLFLEKKDDHLLADLSVPYNPDSPTPTYLSGRASFDASYASNGFALSLRHVDPLDTPDAKTRFAQVLNSKYMLDSLSYRVNTTVNGSLRQEARKDPATADLLRKLRTVVVEKGDVVITSRDVGGGVPAASPEPTPSPEMVATPAG